MEKESRPRKPTVGTVLVLPLLVGVVCWSDPANVHSWRFVISIALTLLATWAVAGEIRAYRKYRAWVEWAEAGGPDAHRYRAP